jgi:hypothetical protein
MHCLLAFELLITLLEVCLVSCRTFVLHTAIYLLMECVPERTGLACTRTLGSHNQGHKAAPNESQIRSFRRTTHSRMANGTATYAV